MFNYKPISEIKPQPQAKLEYIICSFVSILTKSIGAIEPFTNDMEELKTGVSSCTSPDKKLMVFASPLPDPVKISNNKSLLDLNFLSSLKNFVNLELLALTR